MNETVDAARISRDIEAIASFSEAPATVGYSRPTFSPMWRKATDYVRAQVEAIGCTVRVDAAGNLHAHRNGSASGGAPRRWLCGSHIDSVPTGGRFDGVVGVVVALEAMRARPEAPLELIVFAEEEGTTFGLGMLGSRAWAGTLTAEELGRVRNAQGKSFLQAGEPCGVAAERLVAERLARDDYRGLIEVHVEQGARMWRTNVPVSLVTGIAGRHQYRCAFSGTSNHAGSTLMTDRRDALAGAAEAIVALETLGRELDAASAGTVITVGRLDVEPNAMNVIAGSAVAVIDLRSGSEEVLAAADARIRALLSAIGARRGLGVEIERSERLPAVPMDAGVCGALHAAAKRLGVELPETTSGALHDTAVIAPHLPAAMLFVASKDGISHNPTEYSRIEDIALAARIVAEAAGA